MTEPKPVFGKKWREWAKKRGIVIPEPRTRTKPKKPAREQTVVVPPKDENK